MRKLIFIFLIIITLVSCREDIVQYQVSTGSSNLYINTNPSGADIYLDGVRTYKLTPDSLSNLDAGNHRIRLKLVGYNEVQFDVFLSKGEKRYITHSFNNDF